MASLNKCLFLGNLGKDPELKFIPSGQAVCNFSMATTRKYKDSSGEWKEETSWMNIVVWGKSAEACGEYLKKGSPVLVEARVQNRSWEKDGVRQYRTEFVAERVQFLGAKPEKGSHESSGSAELPPAFAGGADDDIPF